MRQSILDPILGNIQKSYDLRLSDWDIENLIEESRKKGRIARLVAGRTITRKKATHYRKILESDLWDQLQSQWVSFQENIETDFNTPVSMRVFDYTESGEKEVTMTPLDSIKYHRKFLQTGILAIDPRNGEIKTWVGGINHKYFQFDHIQTSRQVGSTFKPFVYSTAIALQGFSPCFPVVDQPYTIAPGDGSFGLLEPWTPQNADGKYTMETFTLYEGLKESKNTVSVFLMQQLGNANVVRGLVHNMGIDSSTLRSDGEYRVPNVPSICLGSADLSVMEMTGAYTTFANNGLYNKPFFVHSIEDENGRIVYRSAPEEQLALPPKANYVILDMLKKAATNLGGIKSEVGGKTGTTNDFVDGWFIGITPSLVVGTWVGGEDPWIRFLSLANGQGSVMAKPFFREFMKKIESNKNLNFDTDIRFYKPSGGLDIEIDCEKYRQFENSQNVDSFDDQDFIQDEFNEDFENR
jgi:penicillin-binding protein 1A